VAWKRRWPRVVKVFSAANLHQAHLFTNCLAIRMKVLMYDGIGTWLAARRLHHGHSVLPPFNSATQANLSRAQLHALLLGLP